MTSRRSIALAARPDGPLRAQNFMHRDAALPPLRDGEVLVRVRLLSMDPYLRTAMDQRPLVGPSIPLGTVIPGRGIGEVVESRAPSLARGQMVLGELGWQDYGVIDAAKLRVIKPSGHPLSWYLGVLGVPGMTAFLALQLIGRPKENETVFVSSAAGALGSAAGQIAKALGCKTIGVTTGNKIELCRSKFGFDDCLARDAGDLPHQLSTVTEDWTSCSTAPGTTSSRRRFRSCAAAGGSSSPDDSRITRTPSPPLPVHCRSRPSC